MTFRVLPYRAGSHGASALAQALPGGRVLRLRGSAWRPRRGDIVINWGNTDRAVLDHYRGTRLLNGMDLRNATNKLNFFRSMTDADCGDIIPQYWEMGAQIPDEMFAGDNAVVCRTVLAGHSGEGIVIANNRNELVRAPLFTQYIKKQQEFRIHVGRNNNGQSIIIAAQRKARNRAVEDANVNWQVRNHSNGFIYTREGFVVPDAVYRAAERALAATAIDFGGVDVVYNERSGRAYVLEINTACGLEGQTVTDYANFFRSL